MTSDSRRVKEILAEVRQLAAEYYQLTQKPLGVTGEVAEYVAAEKLGLKLEPARTSGYDAIRSTDNGSERIQIKGRALEKGYSANHRVGKIKAGAACDKILLVIMDNATLEPIEMWEAPYAAVVARLAEPGSKARNERGSLSVGNFKRLAQRVWP